ncbi:hypothetical protein M2272_005332 [Mycobacterium frederiksbergense]|uniref:Uncharacterized protein n=1 Tax=Mycolicibacterium frederiksbergense TaxID=117567 RepID=A0ABT6L6T8_9MYCO|nr:hypothetical protein [Mycolicibacterium frederiksbergense]MDH6198672.1 hypothetical protein [Mycolicibacterium frederiksbergense]
MTQGLFCGGNHSPCVEIGDPPGLYRAKGFLDFGAAGDGRKFLLQLVGSSL